MKWRMGSADCIWTFLLESHQNFLRNMFFRDWRRFSDTETGSAVGDEARSDKKAGDRETFGLRSNYHSSLIITAAGIILVVTVCSDLQFARDEEKYKFYF